MKLVGGLSSRGPHYLFQRQNGALLLGTKGQNGKVMTGEGCLGRELVEIEQQDARRSKWGANQVIRA